MVLYTRNVGRCSFISYLGGMGADMKFTISSGGHQSRLMLQV